MQRFPAIGAGIYVPALIGSSSTPPSAFGSVHEFFNSTGFEIGRNVTLLTVAVFWLGLAFWVNRDARRRIDDWLLVSTATLLGLVPFVGPLVYLLFRPPETLEDARARAAEIRALEARVERRRPECPVCRSEVESSYLVCPVCTSRLREPCGTCSAPLERLWQACPYCATPVGPRPRVESDLDAALSAEAALQRAATAAAAPRRPRPRRAAAS